MSIEERVRVIVCEQLGVGDDEVIGDFGLVGGGAACLELDRYDL